MNLTSIRSMATLMLMLICAAILMAVETQGAEYKPVKQEKLTCYNRASKCFMKYVYCPQECPEARPKYSNAKACFLDCYSPKCEAVCRKRKPNCDGPGAACFDPRFIGGDGIVFYFHGKINEHFSLLSDINLQINARFIGLRPVGRTRDFTWIQALGIMSGSHNLTLEATKTEKWDQEIDRLQLTYDGDSLDIPQGHFSGWTSVDNKVRLERTSNANSVMITISDMVEISVNVVPITEEDNAIHNYQIPDNDSFAHLEVQFRFFGLSSKVDGVLGRTYRPDFNNPAKPGVAMAVVGGDDKYRTSALLGADCKSCVFSPGKYAAEENKLIMERGFLDCSGKGNGIVCKK